MRSPMARAKRRQAVLTRPWRGGASVWTVVAMPPGLRGSDGQPVADAANSLQIYRIGRVRFDLPAQAVDLDVDRALAGRTVAGGQVTARHRDAGRGGEDRHDLALAIGQVDRLAAAAQLALLAVEGERSEADLLDERGF